MWDTDVGVRKNIFKIFQVGEVERFVIGCRTLGLVLVVQDVQQLGVCCCGMGDHKFHRSRLYRETEGA